MEHLAQEQPLISVIMPAYNAERWIAEALDSVLAQTWTNWELLILDDGSTDGTAALARDYAARDGRIRYCRNPENLGVAGTRNRGLSMARGAWVALLDSDDSWRPEKLARQLSLGQQEQADIVYCSYSLLGDSCADFIVPARTTYASMLRSSVFSCSTVLLSQRVARSCRFPTQYYHEDYALWLALLRSGFRAVGCTEVLADYRVAQGSRSRNKLRSARYRWQVYRRAEGLTLAESLRAFAGYALCGLKKYRRL